MKYRVPNAPGLKSSQTSWVGGRVETGWTRVELYGREERGFHEARATMLVIYQLSRGGRRRHEFPPKTKSDGISSACEIIFKQEFSSMDSTTLCVGLSRYFSHTKRKKKSIHAKMTQFLLSLQFHTV